MSERTPSPLSALLLALFGFVTFAIGDGLARSVAGQWPGTAIGLLRYGVATLVLGALLAGRRGGAGFTLPKPWTQLGRGVAIALSGSLFWISLTFIPLPDATAILFTNPVWTALLSALFLGERIDRTRGALILVAFAGVLIVLQPNVVAFGFGALLPLGSALCMAALMIFNRRIADSSSVLGSQFWLAAIATVVLVPMTWLGDLSGNPRLLVGWPSIGVVIACLLIAITGSVGHLMIYLGTRSLSAASIAPMGYVQILMAILIGWIAFGSPPTASMLLGGAIIVGAGWLLIRSNIRTADMVVETGITPD